MIQEYDGSGNLQKEFVEGLGTDEHLMMVDYTGLADGEKYYYVLAHNNSVDKIVDETGDIKEEYEYSPYGISKINGSDTMVAPVTGNPYGFQGRRVDPESGLMYFRNRQYSPQMKRFVSMDPLGL